MILKIGTRKSRLALSQAQMVCTRLEKEFPDLETQLVHITTAGDRHTDRPLAKIGGSGVFVREIEKMLQSGEIDIAVHSAKDLPVELCGGLEISGVLKRGDPRDILIVRGDITFDERSALNIGTGSVRRRQNLKKLYPNFEFSDIRGNVDTRLKKLREGMYDGIVLACAGLERINADLSSFNCRTFECSQFLPAACQGIIAIECKSGTQAAKYVKAVSDKADFMCFEAEKEALRLIGADCSTPVSAYSRLSADGKRIYMFVSLSPDNIAYGEADVSQRLELVKRLVKSIV
ncbi:MAG: hydroxymethylbilane synthase [Oscillospiraceae bacterium]